MRPRESNNADDLPPTPSIVTLPPCSLCPDWCLVHRKNSVNIGCSNIAYWLGVGPLEPECWVQIGCFHIPLSFLFLTPSKLSMPPAGPGPPSCLQNPSRSSNPFPLSPHPPSWSSTWTTNSFLSPPLSVPTPNMKPERPLKNLNPGPASYCLYDFRQGPELL